MDTNSLEVIESSKMSLKRSVSSTSKIMTAIIGKQE